MGASIGNIIAAVSPDVYCKKDKRKKVKQLLKEKKFSEAAEAAELVGEDVLFNYDAAYKDPLGAWGLKAPVSVYNITYDSAAEGLEPIYFWLLDHITKTGNKVTKITDNFMGSPGSGHHSEMGTKATRIQEEAMKILGAVNQVIKSLLNILYDLKEFKMRLEIYKSYRNGDAKNKQAALISLKQVWMDTVDFTKRGTTSLKQMAAQYDYVTIIDAFMAVNSLDDVTKPSGKGGLDLNERVRRILQQRVKEFFDWIDLSETELTKRYEIEKNYLRSQVSTLKLYSRWLKPYLKNAASLEQKSSQGMQAALVTSFSTVVMEVAMMAQKKYKPGGDVEDGILPEVFNRVKARGYNAVVFVEFAFRGIPQRVSQRGDWAFGGKVDVKFTSCALNDEEMKLFNKILEDDDLGDLFKLIEGTTEDSLGRIQDEIDEFLKEDEKKKDEEDKKKEEDVNPFKALFGDFFKDFWGKKKKDDKKFDPTKDEIKPDNTYEKVIRSQTIITARSNSYGFYDVYKKAHGMASHYGPYEPLS